MFPKKTSKDSYTFFAFQRYLAEKIVVFGRFYATKP